MSALDDIIARSRAPGTFIERRHFTLSREKAIEKLREFSLRHQQQYVLELIQAAVFAGATYIAVDISQTRLLVAWVGGRPYQAAELGSIFDYLFADRGDLATRHLSQLAIGLNALLQRKPRLIRIESGDGAPGTTARMDLDRSGEGQLGIPESALAGTYLLVEYPAGWLSRLSQRQFFPEEGLIETRCLYVPVPVLLNGRAPFGYRASREIHLYGIEHQSRFDDGQRRGVIGLPSQEPGRMGHRSREFRLVVGGVWINTLELAELGGPPQADGSFGPLSGVICDDRLRKTADQSDIVQDRRFVELLHAVQPIATELIRSHSRRSYVPPALPHIPAGAEGSDSTEEAPAEPLPEILPQVGPRLGLPRDALRGLPPGEPLFWIRLDDNEDLEASLDPLRFGQHVLRLTPGQARSLALEAPHASLTPLNNAADADFVRRMLERRQRLLLHSLPFAPPDRPEVQGRLILRFHAAGTPPRWGLPREGDTPLLITAGEETLWTGRLPLGLSRLSAVLELEDPLSEPGSLQGVLTDLIAEEAWRLLLSAREEGDAPPDPGAEADLLCGILTLHSHPHFIAEANTPSPSLRLEVALPRAWGGHADEIARRPLAQTAQGTPLTLADLVALQGDRHETIWLREEADRRALEPLEERLGFGHLLVLGDDARPVLAVRFLDGQWRLLRPGHAQPEGPTLWVKPSLTPGGEGPHPAIGQRGHPEVPLTPEQWSAGLAFLQERLCDLETRSAWGALQTSGHSLLRCQALGRLALLALAAVVPESDDLPILRSQDGRLISPRALLMDGSPLRIAPRHGPSTLEPDTVPLTFDQLGLLSAMGGTPRLHLDDAPAVWQSLADPDDPRWLVRQEVQAPGLRGWLGLRVPFDPTAGILIQSIGTIAVLPHSPGQAPCHGMLRVPGGAVHLARAQSELLALARRQLYQRLADALDHLDAAPHRAAAAAYLAAEAAQRPASVPAQAGMGGGLLPLAALRERLLAALPAPLSGELHLSLLEEPRPRGHAPLRAVADDVRGGLSLLFDSSHPLGAAALRDPRSPAAELLLLEAARLLALWSQSQSTSPSQHPILPTTANFLELQRVLIAQRVAQAAPPRPSIATPGRPSTTKTVM